MRNMFLEQCKERILWCWTLAYSIFHPIKKQILFESFNGKQYSDSPRAISEAMHKQYPEYTLVWALKTDENAYNLRPDYVKVAHVSSFSYYKALATSFAFVTNNAIGPNIYKRRNQFFIQTWHGDRGLKKVLYNQYPDGKGMIQVVDNRVTDLCVAASNVGENTFRTAFRYTGEISKVGMPRNDLLVKRNVEREIYTKKILGIDLDKKVLIYAPTFRDSAKTKQKATVDLISTLKLLEERGEKWTCLIRAHSASKGLDCNNAMTDKFIDVTHYPDMADLLSIGDMLITDYSSCAGDFILTGKPTILAMFDKEEYNRSCREFPFDIDAAGFIIADSQMELENIIRTYSNIEYKNNCKKLLDFFQISESGTAANYICDRLDNAYKKIIKG